jgi:phosphatidylglycerophosphate synthase
MLDIRLRPLKDRLFDSITPQIPQSITPLQITLVGFIWGLLACIFTVLGSPTVSVGFWILNRAFDCLDGSLARHRRQASDLGGFLDLLADFVIYSAIPIACVLAPGRSSTSRWFGVAVLEASFHVNNFVLFYAAAVVEKRKAHGGGKEVNELTSLAMRPALIEGTESAIFFTLMLMVPALIAGLSWSMAILVCVGVVQRSRWLARAL